eukprot:12445977-Alexandrium_andersonii.AAC.1
MEPASSSTTTRAACGAMLGRRWPDRSSSERGTERGAEPAEPNCTRCARIPAESPLVRHQVHAKGASRGDKRQGRGLRLKGFRGPQGPHARQGPEGGRPDPRGRRGDQW